MVAKNSLFLPLPLIRIHLIGDAASIDGSVFQSMVGRIPFLSLYHLPRSTWFSRSTPRTALRRRLGSATALKNSQRLDATWTRHEMEKTPSKAKRRFRPLMSAQSHREQAKLIRQADGPGEQAKMHELLARWIERRAIQDAGLKFADWSELPK